MLGVLIYYSVWVEWELSHRTGQGMDQLPQKANDGCRWPEGPGYHPPLQHFPNMSGVCRFLAFKALWASSMSQTLAAAEDLASL
jgi:hypothetical protein